MDERKIPAERELKIAEYIFSARDKPFCWGEHDCCTFAIGWFEIVTGKDYLSEHRPWKSATSANKILKRLGGLEHLFDIHLTAIHANMARDGDLTIIGGTACLFSGVHCVSVGINGLEFVDRMRASCAWRC